MGKSKDLATRVGIDDNADATAITITNQENVGIGTASPSNYGAAYTSLGVSGSSASAIEGFVGSTLVGYLQAYNAQVLVGSKTNVPLKLVTNDTIQMTIDGSGRVTKPNQPAFHVGVNVAQTLASSATVVFQQQFTNIGSNYNTSNGIFTAPVSGFYNFTYRLLHESVSNGQSFTSQLAKNNSFSAGFLFMSQRYKYQADYTGFVGYISESSSGMIYMAANDTMRVRYQGGQNSTIHPNQNWSYFCGHLVG